MNEKKELLVGILAVSELSQACLNKRTHAAALSAGEKERGSP
jgi:hypothetical protein